MKYFLLFIVMNSLVLTACGSRELPSQAPTVPAPWYNSDGEGDSDLDPLDDPKQLEVLEQSVDTILDANAEAIENADSEAQTLLSPMSMAPAPENRPKDWVPWRAEYFMTDLALTAGGHLGVLALRGTSTVRAYWRQQGPEQHKVKDVQPADLGSEAESGSTERTTDEGEAPTIVLQADSTPAQIMNQLEPAIRAAVVTKKIKDTPEMRQNLLQAAREFQTIAAAIPQNNDDLPWWVSRFRLDIMIDAAGRAEPIGLAGGEVRFRFEWFHIQCKKLCAAPSVPLTLAQQNFRSNLKNFIQATAVDLDVAFSNHQEHSFKSHQMRMGIGISAKGNIGVVKGAGTIVGQIYFTRDIKRPAVRPRTHSLDLAEEEPLFIIEKQPSHEHLQWAKTHGVDVETSLNALGLGFEEAVYKVDRKVFRKGLKRAAKISQFFARRAARLKPRAWKIYELRTAFDTSIGGQLDLVTLAGSTTAQISMFNEKF